MADPIRTPGADTDLQQEINDLQAGYEASLSRYNYIKMNQNRYLKAIKLYEDYAANAATYLDEAQKRLVCDVAAHKHAEELHKQIIKHQNETRQDLIKVSNRIKEIEKREKVRKVLFCIPFVGLGALIERSFSDDPVMEKRLQNQIARLNDEESALRQELDEAQLELEKATYQQNQAKLEQCILPMIEAILIAKRATEADLCSSLRAELNALIQKLNRMRRKIGAKNLPKDQSDETEYGKDEWGWRALFVSAPNEPPRKLRPGECGACSPARQTLEYSIPFQNHSNQACRGWLEVKPETKTSRLFMCKKDDVLRAQQVKALDYKHNGQKWSLVVEPGAKPVFKHMRADDKTGYDHGLPLKIICEHRDDIVCYDSGGGGHNRLIGRILDIGEPGWFFLETPATGQKGLVTSSVELGLERYNSNIALLGERIVRSNIWKVHHGAGFWYVNHEQAPCFCIAIGDLFFHARPPAVPDLDTLFPAIPASASLPPTLQPGITSSFNPLYPGIQIYPGPVPFPGLPGMPQPGIGPAWPGLLKPLRPAGVTKDSIKAEFLINYLQSRSSLPPEESIFVSNKLRFLNKDKQPCTATIIPNFSPWSLAHEEAMGSTTYSVSLQLLDWNKKQVEARIYRGKLYRVDAETQKAEMVDKLPYMHANDSRWQVSFHEGRFFHSKDQEYHFSDHIDHKAWNLKNYVTRVGYPFVR